MCANSKPKQHNCNNQVITVYFAAPIAKTMNKTITALLITLALIGTVTYLYLNANLGENDLDINLSDEEESDYC